MEAAFRALSGSSMGLGDRGVGKLSTTGGEDAAGQLIGHEPGVYALRCRDVNNALDAVIGAGSRLDLVSVRQQNRSATWMMYTLSRYVACRGRKKSKWGSADNRRQKGSLDVESLLSVRLVAKARGRLQTAEGFYVSSYNTCDRA